MMFNGYWRQTFGSRNPPKIGTVDHQNKNAALSFDPLIRVPDFIAATFSRWHLEGRRILPPQTPVGKQWLAISTLFRLGHPRTR
jgi:hypothetical protein